MFEFNEDAGTFSILVVCTGNICRSPLGERLLQHQLISLPLQQTITSAGTGALIGGDVPSAIRDIANSLNAPVDGHVPRQISAEMVRSSTLILTAERSHRSEVVSLVPRASNKTFTLKQFARLCQEHEEFVGQGTLSAPNITQLSDLIVEISDFRSLATPPEHNSSDDVEDPYRRSQADYLLAGDEINKATKTISAVISKYLQPAQNPN